MENNFAIAIPSYNRADMLMNKPNTLDYIDDELMKNTCLFVRKEEQVKYFDVERKYGCIVITHDSSGVPETRDKIIDRFLELKYLIMIDDDLKFAYRKENKYTPLTKETFKLMINQLMILCDEHYPIAGITARQFSNYITEPVKENTRIIQLYCFYMPTINYQEVSFSDLNIPFMTDYYFVLKYLSLGYKNRVLTEFTRDDIMQAPGGCQTYRTTKMCNKSAKALYKAFPNCTSLFWKNNGTWEDIRLSLRVNWKKAFNEELFNKRFNT